jgi:hypothetical protein
MGPGGQTQRQLEYRQRRSLRQRQRSTTRHAVAVRLPLTHLSSRREVPYALHTSKARA